MNNQHKYPYRWKLADEMIDVDEVTLLHQGEREMMLLQVDENIHIGIVPYISDSEPDCKLKL